ncbi:hypothetical protein IV487_12955 [Enterococcus saccharolyticus]|uniref:hypothetical protein n=1 Tax=Enterococcus TaxID=1350 RepID=UPI001E341342|nr:hypothetical protein [Enterococcus saccharolyticus]MCD5003371.1 hypothetical protein [Enterococcus saccharolyticus]
MNRTEMKVNQLKQLFETFTTYDNPNLSNKIFILSYGNHESRCQVKEFYGRTIQQSWDKLMSFYRSLPNENNYLRVDLITDETVITYDDLLASFSEIKRNNYITFGIRLEGFKKRVFLKEELVANAILTPDKNHKVGQNAPNMTIDFNNYAAYVKKKYNVQEHSLNFLLKSKIYKFSTKAYFLDVNDSHELENYGLGNEFRVIDEDNLKSTLDLVIKEGANYLVNQLHEDGKFTYGYFPCYDKQIRNYNSVRHFSSVYALLESAEFLNDETMIQRSLEGLIWGFEHLSTIIDDNYLIKDQDRGEVEYKLGAQAMAILAAAKYTQITNDTQFFEKMKTLTHTIENKFLTSENKTIHVLNAELEIKEAFRIIYYDGEALFSMLRAYELMHDEEIFALCKRLMTYFVENNYEKYRDHWLSYAVNEFLKHEQKNEYYQFGLKNALSKIDFIEKRDTAYPTMLELLVAASKMILKLETYEHRSEVISDEDFYQAKARIFEVMEYRAYHQVTTGVMFPEFAMYFKAPHKIEYGFFARHDRFRMRIDDAEHFLSGFVNFSELTYGRD